MANKLSNSIPVVVVLAIIQTVPAVIQAIGGLFRRRRR